MARGRSKKRQLQIEALETPPVAQVINGDFTRDFVTHSETNTNAMVYRNNGGSPVRRWGDKIDDTHHKIIDHCLVLWSIAGCQQRVTAQYGQRIPGSGNSEHACNREIDAREQLHRIRDYFPGQLADYFVIFENVVRHEIPAGVAGASREFEGKAASARALTIVRFVCDVIASYERI
ncbi:MAG: hypothetical protein NUV75_05745 [Gallionella sp.]|nr:hypothetical protein [Gallionella sp.]